YLLAVVFLFHHPPTSETYALSLHDALPIFGEHARVEQRVRDLDVRRLEIGQPAQHAGQPVLPVESVAPVLERLAAPSRELLRDRSEEHTSELQSRENLVCRLLLEKKNQ